MDGQIYKKKFNDRYRFTRLGPNKTNGVGLCCTIIRMFSQKAANFLRALRTVRSIKRYAAHERGITQRTLSGLK